MKVLKPKYYDHFKCIADKCPYSCCIGWRVDVDKKSFQKYRKVQGKMKQKIKECIHRQRGEDIPASNYGKIKLGEQERCSFLNENDLCDIYIELGEENMCVVCKTYPRSLFKMGQFYERSLSITCPEVAHQILNQIEPMEFLLVDESLTQLDYAYLGNIEYNQRVMNRLYDVRSICIDIAQNRNIPIWKRLLLIKKITINIDKKVSEHTYNEKYLEILYKSLEDDKVIKALDNLSIDYDTKMITLEALHDFMKSYGTSRRMLSIVEKIQNFRQQVKNNIIYLETLEKEFNVFMKDKEIFFEQYIVYYLFANFIKEIETEKEISIEISMLILYYALLRYLMIGIWHEQNKKILQEEMEEIVYIFARETEHNNTFKTGLKKEVGITKMLKDLNCCSILIR